MTNKIIIEEPSAERAEQLYLSGEWCQPRYSEKRDCYILIKKKKAQNGKTNEY